MYHVFIIVKCLILILSTNTITKMCVKLEWILYSNIQNIIIIKKRGTLHLIQIVSSKGVKINISLFTVYHITDTSLFDFYLIFIPNLRTDN